MVVNVELLKRDGGISPVRPFCMSLMTCRDELFAKNSGIPPLIDPEINIYKRRATAQQWWYVTCEGVVGEIQCFQLTKRSESGRNFAFKLVVVKHNLLELICPKRPSSLGIFPRNALLDKSRLAMELRLPMQGGIEPPRPLELTLSAMTRSWVCVLLHETPCQLQKFWDSRASLSVSVSSLIANGREHEMMKIAKSGMSFGQGANKRIILLLVLRAVRLAILLMANM
uniref:Uncharacterized protein n=1 Tax=Oryza nivara TaxID=4536 RepID=A0A0E0G2S3_ORYNI